MSKKLFSKEQQEIFRENKYVRNITEKAITYSDEFKMHAITESNLGKPPSLIFTEAGFDFSVIGKHRAENSLYRWKKAYELHGELGLRDNRNGKSGRPTTRELTKDEIIAKQEAKIAYLEMELEIQKKLDMIERRALKQINKNTKN